MATFMEPKFPISKDQRKQPPRNNATLEDVAEEILNGILCQYEPPNREKLEFQKRYPSILRRPKDKRTRHLGKARSISSASKQRVRWFDEHTNEEDTTETKVVPPPKVEHKSWSVAEACFDAGVEVGCVSNNSHYSDSNDGSQSTKQMMNATEAIAAARAKSPRNHIKEEIVFDDDGNPTYVKDGHAGDPTSPKISLPSAPPPPSKKERFFPELCGVRINCGEEEAYFHVMSRSTKGVSDALRCGPDEDENLEDDYDNSLIDYNDDSDSGSDAEQVPKKRERPRATLEGVKRSQRREEPKSKEKSQRKTMREIIDNYLEQEVDEADWEGTSSPTSSSTNVLRRMWPRQKEKQAINNAPKEKEHRKSESDDEDQNPKQRPERRRASLRSRSPSRRDLDKTNTKSVAIHDVYESIEMVNKDPKDLKKTSIGAKLKSMVANKSPRSLKKIWSSSSNPSTHGGSPGDWDESLPIVPGLSPAEKDATHAERAPSAQVIPPQLPVPMHSHPNSLSPYSQPPPVKNPMIYPQLHPAHPLVHGPQGLDRDDRLERHSFITAHRHVFDQTKNAPVINDDALERQSFIGAYRNGMEGNPTSLSPAPNVSERLAPISEHPVPTAPQPVPTPYYPPDGYGPRAHDDAFERQSFISAHRQGFEARPPPKHGPLSHDDIMERMSYITAYRQGIDPLTVYNTESGVKSFPPQTRQKQRNRSRSPYRRNRSYDSINEGIEGHRMSRPTPAMFYPTMQRDPNVAGMENLRMPDPTPAMFNPAMQRDPNAAYAFPPAANYYNLPQYNPNAVNANYGPYPAVAGDMHAGNEAKQNEVQSPVQDDRHLPSTVEEQQAEPELTWEERTRQAWERIRGGISALTFEATSEEKADGESNKDNNTNTPATVNSTNPIQSLQQYHLAEANNANQYGILPNSNLQPHELTKRVSFGEPQQMIYYDDQDENRSTMSLPARNTKKKMKFRGAKLVGGVLGKVKNSLTKVSSLSRSLSSDTHGTMNSGKSSYSTEWEGPVYYTNHSPRLVYGTHLYGQSYPANATNPVMEQHTQLGPHAPPYHVNQYQGMQQNVMQPIIQNQAHNPQMYYNYTSPQEYAGPPHNGNTRRSL